MRIFEIIYKDGERQWVAAETNIEALVTVLSIESTELDLMQEIKEYPESEWDEMKVLNGEYDENNEGDWEYKTFRQYMNDSSSASIIAATFYED